VALADAVVECFRALGSTGLNLALAHETRARVAAASDDRAGFEHYAALAADQWPASSKRLQGLARSRRPRRKTRRAEPPPGPATGSQVRMANEQAAASNSCCATVPRSREDLEDARSRTIALPSAVGSSLVSTEDD
jgi:hypothetical protein